MLDEFLEAQALLPFRLGHGKDCILQPADWLILNGHGDAAEGYRGRYSTRLGWKRLLGRSGGLVGVVSAGVERIGLRETKNPMRGDVGLVRLPGGEVVGGICTGRMWSVAAEGGQFAWRAEVVRAWGLHG